MRILKDKYFTLKQIRFLLLFLIIPLQSYATHLIGGEMTYTCLGDNLYEIKLIIYRDCGPTNVNGTGFDFSGIITIYNSDNQEIQSVDIFDPETTILSNETVGNDCLELPTDLCIEQGTYTTIVELPPIEGGYQLAYQRCCRNPSIINVPTPDDFGSTFTTQIPGSELISECNSSPEFNNYPPLALCLGDEINVDLSATDMDGDSLVYELTTPFHGSNNINPTEISPPPFTEIPWEAGYSEMYPIDSNPIITIDAETGMITGTPSLMGMFIIGIKVKEYRNGILINEVLRDFRFLVVDCNVTTASIPLSNWYCNTLTVDFTNNSYNAETYSWNFGVGDASSTLFEPSFTYPDTGIYTVTLIANPNTACADTNIISFPLYTELSPFFEDPEPQCVDNNSFDLFGEGIAPQGTLFSWYFGDEASQSSANIPNPTGISYPNPGTYSVSYNLQYNDCDETYYGTIEVFDEAIFPEIPEIEGQCFEGNSFNFTSSGIYPESATFLWEFGENASPNSSTSEHPSDIQFSSSGTQNLTLTVFANGCENSVQSSVEVYEQIPVQIFSSPQNGCEPFTVHFDSNFQEGEYIYNWNLGNGSLSSDSNPSSTYMEGTYDISLNITDLNTNCEGSTAQLSYVNVLPQPISNFSLLDTNIIYGEPIHIINNAQFSSHYKYLFSSGYSTLEPEPEYIVPSIGEFYVTQFALNEYDCVDSSSQFFSIDYHHTIWVPTVFTPNNDMINDFFYPVVTGVESYRLQIFNRWGQIVFDQEGENPKWDGKDNYRVEKYDRYQNTDSYVYQIYYKTLDEQTHVLNGVINLIR